MNNFKRMLFILIIFVMGMCYVNAEEEATPCTYRLIQTQYNNYTHQNDIVDEDTITFYFFPRQGLVNSFRMGVSGRSYQFAATLGSTQASFGKKGSKLLVYPKAVFDYSFTKDTTTCPYGLDYIVFAQGTGNIENVLTSSSLYPELISYQYQHADNLRLVTQTSTPSTKSSKKSSAGGGGSQGGGSGSGGQGSGGSGSGGQGSGGTGSEGQGSRSSSSAQGTGASSRKSSSSSKPSSQIPGACGQEGVISLNNTSLPSDFKGVSLKVQFFMQNGKKQIAITPVQGNEVGTTITRPLHPDVGNVTDIDYYKDIYGGLILRVVTFEDCDKVGMPNICPGDAGNGKIIIIGDCSGEIGGDPSSATEAQPVESYKSAYKSNFPSSSNNSFKIPDIGGGDGFGKSANCKKVLGDSGYNLVNGLIKIVRILAPIVATLVAMITLIPAITAKDEDKVKAATKKCVTIGIVLLVIEVIPYIVRLIGVIIGFDLSCIG